MPLSKWQTYIYNESYFLPSSVCWFLYMKVMIKYYLKMNLDMIKT